MVGWYARGGTEARFERGYLRHCGLVLMAEPYVYSVEHSLRVIYILYTIDSSCTSVQVSRSILDGGSCGQGLRQGDASRVRTPSPMLRRHGRKGLAHIGWWVDGPRERRRGPGGWAPVGCGDSPASVCAAAPQRSRSRAHQHPAPSARPPAASLSATSSQVTILFHSPCLVAFLLLAPRHFWHTIHRTAEPPLPSCCDAQLTPQPWLPHASPAFSWSRSPSSSPSPQSWRPSALASALPPFSTT